MSFNSNTAPSHRPILQPTSRVRGRQRDNTGSSSSSFTAVPPVIRSIMANREQTFEEKQQINRAATMVESNEMLIWASMERNESLPQTKLNLEREMLGLPPSSPDNIEWEEWVKYDSEDERRLKAGVVFTKDGWYNPKEHKSVEDRLNSERIQKEKLSTSKRSSNMGIAGTTEEASSRASRQETPESSKKRRSVGGRTPDKRRSGAGGRRSVGPSSGT